MSAVITPALLANLKKAMNTAFNKGRVIIPNFAQRLNLLQIKSNTAEELYGWVRDLPGMEKNVAEIAWKSIALDAHSIVNDEYQAGIVIPRKDIEDDQYGMYANVAQRFGQEGACQPDYELITLLSALFTTAKAYTGKVFFATDHKIGDAPAFSNKMLKKLSAANFETGYAALRNMKKGNGNPLFTLLDPSKVFLLVSPDYESTADSIVKLAKTAGGGDNPNFNKAQVVVIPGLGDAWMILDCSNYITPIIFQDRIPLTITSAFNETDESVLNANEFKFKIRSRFALGTGDPRFAYGSTGANAA
ncbi:Phage major head subunit gpT-like protein [Gammaproteobacteria bacterium]